MTYDEFRHMFTEFISEAAKRMDLTLGREKPKSINMESDYISLTTEDGKHTVYVSIEERYREFNAGRDIGEMAESIVKGVIPFVKNMPEVPPYIMDKAKESLYLAAVNKEMNRHLLQGIPYKEIGDLVIIPRLNIGNDSYGMANVTLTEDIMAELKLTKEEIMEHALRNTEAKGINIMSLSSVVAEAFKKELGLFPPENEEEREMMEYLLENENTDRDVMYIMTNEQKAEGAGLISSRNAMEQAYEKFGEDFYILPSSRHELMLVPKSTINQLDVGVLKEILNEENREVVLKRDYLSDSVYQYHHKTKSITLADDLTKNISNRETLIKDRMDQAFKMPGRVKM